LELGEKITWRKIGGEETTNEKLATSHFVLQITGRRGGKRD